MLHDYSNLIFVQDSLMIWHPAWYFFLLCATQARAFYSKKPSSGRFQPYLKISNWSWNVCKWVWWKLP